MPSGPDLTNATLGQYQIEALIGQGGMGYVYRARDSVLARPVALKILPPDVVSDASRLSRFIQEARAASALNHPDVIGIYEIREGTPMRGGAAIPDVPASTISRWSWSPATPFAPSSTHGGCP
jgi:serine/threonine protein kinase